MSKYEKIIINPVGLNKEAMERVENSVASAIEANRDISSTKAGNIQKRGYTYNGDRHQGYGLNGFGARGWTGRIGRGVLGTSALYQFSLQPFGIGSNALLGVTNSSIFSGTGAGTSLNAETSIAHLKMAYCVEAYKGFGIVKNVIDLMCNFASEGLMIQHKRPVIRRFYERWAEAVDLQGRIKDILRYYYKYGNVFVYTTMGQVSDDSRIKMMSSRGDNNNDPTSDEKRDFIEEQKKKPLGKREIPWRYTLLNPFQMDIKGNKYFGESRWVFVLDQESYNELSTRVGNDSVDVLNETDINLPQEFRTLPKEDRAVILDQAKLWTLQYMKDDHEDWADPMVWPVMNDIIYKHDLRAMDRSVVDSTINAITIFKLGKLEQGVVATPNQYSQFAEMLRTPTASHNIIWNDAIAMESNYPPIDKILGIQKYESVDKDILAGLGIPSILVDGGKGGSYSNAFLQVRTLLERLEEGRREVMKWVNRQFRMIAEIMGHRDIPNVKFGQMSLRDEQAEKQLIIQLLDRNIISAEAVHEVFGLETLVEIERIRREDELADKDGIFIKHGPYKEPMTDLVEEDKMDKEFNQKQKLDKDKMNRQSQQKQEININGRPPGSKNIPQEKKRNTKPQGMGLGAYEEIRALARDTYDYVEKELTDRMLIIKDVKWKKSLSGEDKIALDKMIHIVFSNMTDEENTIDEILCAPSINNEFESIFEEIIKDKNLTASEKREARIIALSRYFWEEKLNGH